MSHDAEYYMQHSEDISHKYLLREIGASEDMADSFSDKGMNHIPTLFLKLFNEKLESTVIL